jgi:hypothetical protein
MFRSRSSTPSNNALVTKTLVGQAAQAIQQADSLSLRSFLALSNLCEAAVILDKLYMIKSSDALLSLPLTSGLREAGLLREFEPAVSRSELARVISLLPEEITNRLIIDAVHRPPGSSRREGDNVLDDQVVGPTGAVSGFDYEATLEDLSAQLDSMVTFPSMAPNRNTKEYIQRSNGYLIVAAASGLDYFPDFDRVPFAASISRALYRSMPVRVYERVAQALDAEFDNGDEFLSEWTLDAQLPIPPITALVLNRASSLEQIPACLLEIREEFAKYRDHFRDFKSAVQSASTLKERRVLQAKFKTLLAAASGPDAEIISTSEILNLAEKSIQLATNPLAVQSYSTDLLRQPIEWVRRWWLRRPIAVLFRLDSKLPKIAEYRNMVTRLWGKNFQDQLIEEFAFHGHQIERLMA